MSDFILTPKVDETQEFIEIANDFANPLDLVREAISNAFDARAADRPLDVTLSFTAESILGEQVLVIRLTDNGTGMGKVQLQSFFDLGNSTRRGNLSTIGEKGHGTKVFFNSKKVVVDTCRDGTRLIATLDSPFAKLHNREIPQVSVHEEPCHADASGTTITIHGYNNNRRDRFTHARLRDHILWFTKFGSIEKQFGITALEKIQLKLKGLDQTDLETLSFGHVFPKESENVNNLFSLYSIQAPRHYCRRIVKTGCLPHAPEISFHAVFSIEGSRVKYDSNPMLRRSGYSAPEGGYIVQERYGLWLCKDFIPIQRKNEWITSRGSEFTKLHAFFNCQALKLTANRGSVDNTPSEILQDVEEVVRKMYQEIIEGQEWLQLSYLEEEAEGFNTIEKEKRNFSMRIDKVNKANIARYKNVVLVEPQRESGVHSLIVQLLTIEPELLPFTIVDYDTLEGIDVIVKARDTATIRGSKLYYVEFKYFLDKTFNHSFENLHSIICWDTNLKNGELVKDINKEDRKLSIVSPGEVTDHTHYFLDNPRSAHRIEVFVLKDYLPIKLGVPFRPRTSEDVH